MTIKDVLIEELMSQNHSARVEDVIYKALKLLAEEKKKTWFGGIAKTICRKLDTIETNQEKNSE